MPSVSCLSMSGNGVSSPPHSGEVLLVTTVRRVEQSYGSLTVEQENDGNKILDQ